MVAFSKSIESFCVALVPFSGKFHKTNYCQSKTILSSTSVQCSFRLHFRALFTYPFVTENRRDVHVRFVRTEIMKCVIDFAYASSCRINDANVIELLATAEYFGFLELINQCADHIENSLTPTNCISLMAKTRFDCNIKNHNNFSIL